jgi:hypothetical protein
MRPAKLPERLTAVAQVGEAQKGLIRQRMTQRQRDLMIAHMPAPVVEMWTSFGENAFNQLIAEVGPPLG